MDGFASDLRLAFRRLRKERAFATAAVLALALGVGANTAIFSVVEAVLLRPLPFPDADRLVSIWDENAAKGATHVNPSPGNFLDWEKDRGAFGGMAVWYAGRGTFRVRDTAEVVQTLKASPAFFDVLRVAPLLGRVFHAGELRGAVYNVAEMNQGGDRALVLSERFWRSQFGADAGIVGRTISFDGAEWAVLGVVPDAISLLSPEVDVYLPWDIPASFAKLPSGSPRDFRFVNVVARLADGVTLPQAAARMSALAASLAEAHPKANRGWTTSVVPLADELRGPVRGPLLLLFGATCFVLVVACLNVASLQVARAVARQRDTAVRAALGASGSRLFRQALAEGLLLAAAGTAAGLAVAWGGLHLLLSLQPWQLPAVGGVTLNARVLLFSLTAAVATALLCGAGPILASARAPLASLLSQGGRGANPGSPRQRLRRTLVALQVAATLVLMTGAGLFARSFAKARAVTPGFDARALLVMRISLDKAAYRTGDRAAVFHDALTKKLSALPGVVSAGAVTALPMSKVGVDFARPYWREGEADPGGQAARAAIRMATPRYFETLRMPLLRGRVFTDDDRDGTPRVIVINETLARRAFGAEDPVGQRLIIDYQRGAYPYEVVGLVADTRFGGLKSEPLPELFIPHQQNPYLDLNVVVRTLGAPEALAAAARKAVKDLDAGQPVHSVVTMEQLVGESVAADRFFMTLFSLLAAVALALAATGIYGLLAYLVRRRSHELGVRQALGARPADVLALVLGESARLAGAGALLGLALALFLGRLAQGLLFGVTAFDPLTFAGVAVLLGGVVLLASALPARAAARIDPVVAMRSE